MKYDSGMTHFHENIIAALRHMLGNNSEITKKFSPNDGSPAPLRDYLKEKYGKSYTSHIGNGMRYSCKTSTGFELTFDTILNNPGDKNLTLSWSQVAKFIRDNWDEVFKKDKPKSRPLETLVRTFDEEAMTCPNWVRGKTLTYLEKVNGVHFECQAFSAEFCKLDDITKFFVQHCNCPENCSYYKETAEKQPSYLDKLRERYPKVNVNDEWFGYCPAELFDGDDVPSVSDGCPRDFNTKLTISCEECWNRPCSKTMTFYDDLEMFEDDYFEEYPPAEDTAEADEAVPEISEEKSNVEKSLDRETTQKWDFYCEGCKYDINSCCNYPETPDDYCVCGDKRIPKSEADKPKPTYKDVFLEHYPDFDVGQFDEFIFDACLSEFFDDRGSTKCPEHHDCKICWYSECKHMWDITEEGENDIKPYLKTRPSSADTETDDPPENQIIPKDTSEISNTFNYSVLSTEMGDYLKHKEQQLKNEYMNFTANCGAIFAEAQERLAKHGFGENNGLFEKWIASIGFKRDTVYRMISVYNFRSSQIATNGEAELFDSLSKSLQYEIAKPSAPAELVEQVLNGDITTHKDYIKLKAELDRTREECKQIDANSAAKDKEYARQLEEANKRAETEQKARESISKNFDSMTKECVRFKNMYTDEYYKNTELEKHVKELESRPIDVCVDHNEVTKRVTEAVNKINSETEKTLAAREQEFAETLHFKDERIWELEDKLKELGAGGTCKKVYMVSMTEEDYQKMILELSGGLCKILSAAVVIDLYGKRGDSNG